MSSARGKTLLLLQAAVIMAAAWFVFSPALHGGWLWDDNVDITENSVLRNPAGLWHIWFGLTTLDYYPLKNSVQWVEWHLWGMNTFGYHVVNVALHILSALLVWRLLARLGLRFAWVGGLIFAVHPLVVESVAWIVELKNALSMPLLLGAMIAYVAYDDRRWGGLPPIRPSRRTPAKVDSLEVGVERAYRRQSAPPYLAALLLFLAALLSKTSVVMFPVVILLYAWWKRGRISWGDVRASAPFFALSLATGLLTLSLQNHRAISEGEVILAGGFLSRLAVAGLDLAFYLWKFILPVGLLPIYPRWKVDPPALWQFWPWVAMGGVLGWAAFCFRSGLTPRREGAKHLLFGLGFFAINLAPVLGFAAISFLRISWVADHFAYISIVGLIGLTTAGLGALYDLNRKVGKIGETGSESGSEDRSPNSPSSPTFLFKTVFWIAALGVIAALAIESHRYAAAFGGSQEALWTYELQRNPKAWLAHGNLGLLRLKAGRTAEAMAEFNAALRLRPDDPVMHYNLGNSLMESGRQEEAKSQFEEALRLNPQYAAAHNSLGNVLAKSGDAEAAVAQYQEALRLDPDYPEGRENLGAALQKLGRLPEAMAQYDQALHADPSLPSSHFNLAVMLAGEGQFPEAIAHYREALRLKPDWPEAENNLGNAFDKIQRGDEAIAHYERALALKPDYFDAHFNLANALFNANRVSEAIGHYEQALRLRPDYFQAHNNLGVALQAMGQLSGARAQFLEALRLKPDYAAARTNLDRIQANPP